MKLRQKMCLVLVFLVFSSFITAYAEELDENLPPDIPEPYVAVSSFSSTLSINNAGRATCSGIITLSSGFTALVTTDLQQSQGSGWNSVCSWSKNGWSLITIDESDDVTSGYWYKVVITATIYDGTGNYVETASVESSSHYF